MACVACLLSLVGIASWTAAHALAARVAAVQRPVVAQAERGLGEVDMALVLAVDVSDSMSREELRVQRHGYVAAFRHGDVAGAIALRATAIAVAYVEWAGPDDQSVVVGWTVLKGREDAERFAARLAEAPLIPRFDSPPWKAGTSIANALLFAADLFSDGPAAVTRVIDISGNGINNSGSPLGPARASVLGRGITVNGLPIVVARPHRPEAMIDAYYEDCVIGGPGAFALAVKEPSDLEGSIRRKIVLEIAEVPPKVLSVAHISSGPRIDCSSAGS